MKNNIKSSMLTEICSNKKNVTQLNERQCTIINSVSTNIYNSVNDYEKVTTLQALRFLQISPILMLQFPKISQTMHNNITKTKPGTSSSTARPKENNLAGPVWG